MAKYKRRIKLIQPRLQLKLIGTFLGMSALAMLLQFLLFTSSMSEVAAQLPEDGMILLAELQETTWQIFLLSFGMLLPLTFLIGVLVTFRWAGPIYRFKDHLNRIARGERPGHCHIRRGDELQDLCQILNKAIDNLQGHEGSNESTESEESPFEKAA